MRLIVVSRLQKAGSDLNWKSYGRAARTLFALVSGVYALSILALLAARLILVDRVRYVSFAADFTPLFFVPLIVLFPLALIARAKRAALIMLPLLIIGLVMFGRWYVPRAEAAIPADALHVLNFNVLYRNMTLDAALTWVEEQNADVLMLQEFRETFDTTRFQAEYPYQARADSSQTILGNIILSRYPLENTGVVTAPNGNGFLRAELLWNDQRIAVYCVHLPLPIYVEPGARTNGANPLWWIRTYDTRVRDSVIRDLLALAQAETMPVIIGGDFNMSEFATVYPEIAAVLTDSYREAGYGLGLSWPVAPFFDRIPVALPLTRIDYIWHSDELRAVRAWQGATDVGSDHAPVQAILTWAN